ncbi:MAG: Gfo/Idh/MocA family oxidoreductase [Treponema sp.]|nr:Gfo/Idh/MocA family oxidoreductase [Treponema sp.]
MEKIRVAIIGYGRSGRDIHTKTLKQLPDLFEIFCYVDADTERQAMIKKEMNKPVFSDYTGLYDHRDDVDLVINASFSQDHARISKELLKRGFNVLSEKPVSKDAAEFQTVLDTAKQAGKKYYAFQQYRFSAGFKKMREIIDSGVLGRIIAIRIEFASLARRWDWQTVHANTAGVLLNNGPHYVDIALILMGFPADVKVFAHMDHANYAGNGEDYVKLIMTSPGAPLTELEMSAGNAYPSQLFTIHGTNGTMKGNDSSLTWKYFIPSEATPLKLDLRPLRNENCEPLYCREKLNFYEENWNENKDTPDKAVSYYRALYDSIVNGSEFPVKAEQVLLQMKVMGEAHAQNSKLFDTNEK